MSRRARGEEPLMDFRRVIVAFGAMVMVANIAAADTGARGAAAATTQPTWSHRSVSRTPSGVTFHGPFARDEVEVTFGSLGAHEWLAIEFDLLILRSWDGSVPVSEQGIGRPIAA